MEDPQPLFGGFADLVNQFPPEHRLHQIAAGVLGLSNECAERRARVLKHPDLAKRLTELPIGYAKASQWNGWVPPQVIDLEATREVLRDGKGFRNPHGRLALGERQNDSPRRAALVDIAAEAWRREQEVTQ
jgi:hypothetical protein